MPGRLRVLVADDHRVMLDTLVRLLSREFDVVAAVTDGISAVDKAAELQPDLLVLDIAMPGLSGIAAARAALKAGSTARIVFVTNMRDREFVDGSMPGLSGIAAARAALKAGSTARIVFVTNMRDREFVDGSMPGLSGIAAARAALKAGS